MRFPELYRELVLQGAEWLAMPAAFTVPTGRAHWETLLRARAIENLCYVVAPAQSGLHTSGRETYGDSLIVDYWGQVLSRLAKGSGVITADIDLAKQAETRARFPALDNRRLGFHGRRGDGMNARSAEVNEPTFDVAAENDSGAFRIWMQGAWRPVLDAVMSRGVDYADLYFQLSREESWSLEDGIVKEGSHSIEQGVGVRAISGEKTGFAYTDEVLLPALLEASDAARAIARSGGRNAVKAWQRPLTHRLYLPAGSARCHPRRGQGGVADAHRRRYAPHRSAGQAGDGVAGRRSRSDTDRDQRRHPDRGRAAAGAAQRLGHRRAERPPRAGL